MKQQNLKVNALLNTIKTLFSIIFPLITFPYVSRVLMPENIGKVNFGSSFVSYFSLIASLGIATYAIRECSAKRNDKNELSITASQIFSINICTTVIAYVSMIVTLLFFRNFDSYRTLILIQSTAILFTTLGCDWLNTAMEDFTFITIRTIAFQVISIALMFMLIHGPENYIKYALITVLSSSGANITNIFYRKRYCKVKFVTEMNWKKHFKPIALLFVMILAQNIFNNSDITMLGLMKGNYEVGLYSTAVKMSNLVSQIVASMAWVIMPRMSLYFAQEDYEKINVMLKKALSVLITLGLPCAIGCICLSKEIVLIISGSQYLDASTALSILMVCFIFSLMGGSFLGNMVLLPSKKEGLYMKICCVSTGINLVLNYFLIPIWGVNAAACTTAFSSFLILLMLVFTKDRRIKIEHLLKVFVAPCGGCLLIILSCVFVKNVIQDLIARTIVSVALSGISYFCIQFLLKNEIVIQIITLIKRKIHKKI